MTIYSKIFSTLVLATIASSTVLGLGIIKSEANYNKDKARHEYSLKSGEIATYKYSYINTAPEAAQGYFELTLEDVLGKAVTDSIEVVSIKETFPVDIANNFKPREGANVIETAASSAAYADGNNLKIRLSPQSNCATRPEGGCSDSQIPADVASSIEINLKVKSDTQTVIAGQGKVYFPNGFDINPIGLLINTNGVAASPEVEQRSQDLINSESTDGTEIDQKIKEYVESGNANTNPDAIRLVTTSESAQDSENKNKEVAVNVDGEKKNDKMDKNNQNSGVVIAVLLIVLLIGAGVVAYLVLNKKIKGQTVQTKNESQETTEEFKKD